MPSTSSPSWGRSQDSMAGVRSMLARVSRLEVGDRPSPFVAAYGSFEAFIAWCETDMDEGRLDRSDVRQVLAALLRWEKDGTWGAWRRAGNWQSGNRR